MLPLEVIELPDGDNVKWSNRNLVGFRWLQWELFADGTDILECSILEISVDLENCSN